MSQILHETYQHFPFPGGSDSKESACVAGDLGSIPGLENPHGQRSLAGYSLWCCKELDMTEQLSTAQDTWVISGLL